VNRRQSGTEQPLKEQQLFSHRKYPGFIEMGLCRSRLVMLTKRDKDYGSLHAIP
jgi:hypothetical protein